MPSIITKCESPRHRKHDKTEHSGFSYPAKSPHQVRFLVGKRGWDTSPWVFLNLDNCLVLINPATQLVRSKHNKEHQYLWGKEVTLIQNVSGQGPDWSGSRGAQAELSGVRRVGFHPFHVPVPEPLLRVQPGCLEG